MGRNLGGAPLAIACVVGLTLACFGPALADGRQLAYRDYSEFYYPLYQRVQQEWEAGRLPLWASEENGGSPMLGNPTSAVLYPGKLIYAALPFPRAAKVYAIAHVLLAFGSMVALLRRGGVSSVGSTLGGLAYAFGAPVLTQYSNIVFLVGAAWMPLGFRFADGWVRLRRPRSLAGLALVLAMQVLGGDPEAAYLTAFASGAYAVGGWIFGASPGRRRRLALTAIGLTLAYGGLLGLEVAGLPSLANPAIPIDAPSLWWHLSPSTASLIAWGVAGLVILARWPKRRGRLGVEGSLLGLLAACVLGAAITAAQLLPTLEFVGQSTRGETASHADIYAHSIHPARVVEWAWPHAFGSTIRRNHNWLTALPPTEDQRVWMTSLSMGGLTLLLAAVGAWSRGGSAIRGWMTGVALVGVLAGFGTFASPLFWVRANSGAKSHWGTLELPEPELPRADGRLRDGDGGPYWFLASILPGFRSFRYPGKLFVPASLGMAALAGIGFDGLVAGRRRLASALACTLLAAGLAGLGFAVAWPDRVLKLLGGTADAATSTFGPFDPSGAASDLRWALIHGATILVAFLVLSRLAPRRPLATGILTLLVMTVDLAFSNRGEVATIPQAAYEADSRMLDAIRRAERADSRAGPFRIFRPHGWAPGAWRRKASPDRVEEIVRWERETLKPKYEQPLRVASTFAFGTVELADYGSFFAPFSIQPDPALASRLGLARGSRVNYYSRRGFDLWNTRYFILPTRLAWDGKARGFASLLPETEPIYPPPTTGPEARARLERWGLEEDVQVVRNLNAYPRAWVVHRAIPVGTPGGLTRADQRRVMVALIYQDDVLFKIPGREVVDPHRVAWVEAPAAKLAGMAGATEGSEPVQVEEGDDPTRVALQVTLRSPGLVILADVHYPGWRLEVDGQSAEILRVDRMMRGAVVPAGTHRLVYTYRPPSVVVGIGLSAVGLLAWLGLMAFGRSAGSIGASINTSGGAALEGRPR